MIVRNLAGTTRRQDFLFPPTLNATEQEQRQWQYFHPIGPTLQIILKLFEEKLLPKAIPPGSGFPS